MFEVLSGLSLLLYALACVASVAGLLSRPGGQARNAACVLLALGIISLAALTIAGRQHLNSRAMVLIPLTALVGLIALAVSVWYKQSVLTYSIPPFSFVIVLAALLFSPGSAAVGETIAHPTLLLHIGSIALGTGLIGIAAGAGVLFLILQRNLKRKGKPSRLSQNIPSLAALDKINAVCVKLGFPLYTLGILCGFIWEKSAFGSVAAGDPKAVVSAVILVLYGLLFYARHALGWQGRKTARLAIIIAAASLFSLFVVNTLFPTHHSFF
ncbi:MAG: cytochrome c biogenesis protein CcsA [Mailhella sp.]|nr:cytochrome c biogenesis protein CcsA [Mailhella sp.]